MSEKCDNCGRDFFITSKREQRDVDFLKEKGKGNLCDRCRSRYYNIIKAEAVTRALSSTTRGRNLLTMMNVINGSINRRY